MSHESLSTEAIKKIPPRDPLDSRPPPPPPKRRRDSNFPLQAFSTRFNKSSTNIAKSSCTIVGTVDGSIGVLVPIEEKMYRRLAVLQQIMIFTVKTPLALNPREYRLFKSTRFRFQKRKGVLDGCILWLFFTLHPTIQAELADVLGVSAYTIKENLREIECYSTFF
jgi:cleavage and polyadenylation specificity factor subunit 1